MITKADKKIGRRIVKSGFLPAINYGVGIVAKPNSAPEADRRFVANCCMPDTAGSKS